MPTLVKVATGFALFAGWVIFEEGIVDRTGLWKRMPLYIQAQPSMPLLWASARKCCQTPRFGPWTDRPTRRTTRLTPQSSGSQFA